MLNASDALRELRALGDPEDARFLQRFFKTGQGEYGEGDVFLGIRVPATRRLARKYRELPLPEIGTLLQAKEHEARLLALILLTQQYQRADQDRQQKIFEFYLAHTTRINNWDLVDVSAPSIVGAHLYRHDKSLLDELALSASLWERRIAMLATAYFIKRGEYAVTLRIARRLLKDEHDLIHKAVGWMLREVGNRDRDVLLGFLDRHYRAMPRTMLRYAIEKLEASRRAKYMEK